MKNKQTATLLALLLGGLGVHYFYLGKPIKGLFYMCIAPLAIVLSIVDAIEFSKMRSDAFNAIYNSDYFDVVPKKRAA